MTTTKILCTGGAGYIGIHTVCALFESGFECVVVDNLSNDSTSRESVRRLEKILDRKISFYEVDVKNYDALLNIFTKEKFDGIIHFAGYKAVGESCQNPLRYYQNNIIGLLNLIEVAMYCGVPNFVYSSSATVYRPSDRLLTEDSTIGASNPYGHTKVFGEQILRDVCDAHNSITVSSLRYFNPVGAHPSGQLGESADTPLNILPFIQQVAIGRKEALDIFGSDWPTRDGTGMRDYIHVSDLADGHVAAMVHMMKKDTDRPGRFVTYNLGTGKGTTVLELVKEFEEATGKHIPCKIVGRRPGDIAAAVADCSRANEDLSWKSTRTLKDACASAFKWQQANPTGYVTSG